MSDLIDELVGIAPGDHLDTLRAKRPIVRRDAQASYEELIVSPSDLDRASAAERAAIGYWVAALSQAAALAGHYRSLLASLDPRCTRRACHRHPRGNHDRPLRSYPPGPLSVEDEDGLHWTAPASLHSAVGDRLAAALEHTHLLTFRPRDSNPKALQALLDAGWTTDGIVTISQLVAFIHFQLRVIAGLNVLKEAN
jgi:CMD domain protein